MGRAPDRSQHVGATGAGVAIASGCREERRELYLAAARGLEGDITVDEVTGVFGHRVTMLDIRPDRIDTEFVFVPAIGGRNAAETGRNRLSVDYGARELSA